MKSYLYFKHDADAMRDTKLNKLLLHKNGPTLYGLYWLIIEFLFGQENNQGTFDQLRMLARSLKIPLSKFLSVVTDFDLFVIEEETFYSKGLIERVKEIEEKRAEKLKKEAQKLCSSMLNENPIQQYINNIHNLKRDRREEKRKEEESREEKSIPEESKEETILENEKKELSTSSSISSSSPSSSPEPEKKDCSAGEKVEFIENNNPWGHEPLQPVMDWGKCVDEAFKSQEWYELVGMKSQLGEMFRDNPLQVKRFFIEHVKTQGNESAIRSVRQAKNYFANMMQPGSKSHHDLAAKLRESVKMENKNPFEDVDKTTGKRSYFGFPIPDDAPPRPSANAVWNVYRNVWMN